MFPKMNPRFAAYIAPAQAYPQIWRLVAGSVMAVMIYFGFITAVFQLTPDTLWVAGSNEDTTNPGSFSSPRTMVILMVTFVGMALGVFAAAQFWQNRTPRTLFGPDLSTVWRNFLITSGIVFVIGAVLTIVTAIADPSVANLPFGVWLRWVPLSLLLVFIQTTSEELVFRGYFQQQLAARFASPLVWWSLPSALFALAHYDPETMGSNTWLIVVDTFLVGLIAADLTSRTGNLGAAMGLHFVNNIFAIMFVALDGEMTGFALHVTSYTAQDTEIVRSLLIIDIAFLAIAYLIYLRIMVRRGFG